MVPEVSEDNNNRAATNAFAVMMSAESPNSTVSKSIDTEKPRFNGKTGILSDFNCRIGGDTKSPGTAQD